MLQQRTEIQMLYFKTKSALILQNEFMSNSRVTEGYYGKKTHNVYLHNKALFREVKRLRVNKKANCI